MLPSRPGLRAAGLAAFVAATLAGCSTTSIPALSVNEANSQVRTGYLLAAGDKLKVTVFDEPSLTGEFLVGSGGDLALPLIQPVSVVGQSAEAVAKTVAAALSQGGYVLEPRVSVEVMQYRPVYILGEVSNPGEYPHTGELTFLQAVAKAGGFTPRADKGTVILQRPGEADRLVRLGETPLIVAPGDTMIVREAFF